MEIKGKYYIAIAIFVYMLNDAIIWSYFWFEIDADFLFLGTTTQ